MRQEVKIYSKMKRAQSFLEYSFTIAVTVGALIVMGTYMSRSLQGLLKDNADNLGGEKIAHEKYTPGTWYGPGDQSSKSVVSTWGFDYEGERGFGVSTGGYQMDSQSQITGPFNDGYLNPPDRRLEPPIDQAAADAFRGGVSESDFDPDTEQVQQNVNAGEDWNTHTASDQQISSLTAPDMEDDINTEAAAEIQEGGIDSVEDLAHQAETIVDDQFAPESTQPLYQEGEQTQEMVWQNEVLFE